MGYKCLVFLCIIVIFGWFSRDNFRRLGLLSDLYKAIINSLLGCVYVFVFGFEFILLIQIENIFPIRWIGGY